MRGREDALLGIAEVSELAEGLSLVLCVGPDFRAEEAFELISGRLPGDRPRLVHRLDRDGPDLPGRLRGAPARPIVFVHGFEYLHAEERAALAARLNLLRDSLVPSDALIVLWLPRTLLDELQKECTDLFQWRTLLCELGQADVPVRPAVEARRRHLATLICEPPLRDALMVQPMVRVAGGPRYPIPLTRWADQVADSGRPCLLHRPFPGPQEETFSYRAGQTWALWFLAQRFARGALWGAYEPVPILLSPSLPASLMGFPERIHVGPMELISRNGDGRILLLDDLDESIDKVAQKFCQSLSQICVRHPNVRIISAGYWEGTPFPAEWPRAELCPFNAYQSVALMKLRAQRPGKHLSLPAPPFSPAGRVATLTAMGLSSIPERLYEGERRYVYTTGSIPEEAPLSRQRIAFDHLGLRLLEQGPVGVELKPLLDEFERDLGVTLKRDVVALELAELLWLVLRPDGRVDLRQGRDLPSSLSSNDLKKLLFINDDECGLRSSLSVEVADRWHRGGRPSAWPIDELAASALVARGIDGALAALRPHLDDRLWEDVVICTVARLVRLEGRADFLWDFLWPPASEPLLPRSLRLMSLALEIAAEAFLPAEATRAHCSHAQRVLDSAQQAGSEEEELARSMLGCALGQLPFPDDLLPEALYGFRGGGSHRR